MPKQQQLKIIVIGDTILDSYTIGSSERLSPEAPIPVVKKQREKFNLGGAANVARNLKHLGVDVRFFSAIGKDDAGERVKDLLRSDFIDTGYLLERSNIQTTHKNRIQVGQHQIVRIDDEVIMMLTNSESSTIYSSLIKLLESESIDCVIISDYAKGFLTDDLLRKLIEIAVCRDLPVLVDPKGSDFSKYAGATLLTPNKSEAIKATGIEIDSKENLSKALIKSKEIAKSKYSLVTLGEEGIALLNEERLEPIFFPAKSTEVFDVSGAGDTVIAAIAYALANGEGIQEALVFANLAASVVIKKLGASTATMAEIDIIRSSPKPDKRILDFPSDIDLVRRLSRSKDIVFTNGCFDLLHLGHLKLLEEAARLGSMLVVGLNSDSSVSKLKGESRPINQEKLRSELLNALGFVDYVIIFSEETPLNLLKELRPKIIVKGGDYLASEVIGREYAQETIIFPTIEDFSTSKIIDKINVNKFK